MNANKALLLLTGVVCSFQCAIAQTWLQTSAPNNPWTAVASSADGNKLVAVSHDNDIFTSTNSGASWSEISNYVGGVLYPTARGFYWISVASSADGTKLAAASWAGNGECIFITADSGANWQFSSAPALQWFAIASSADGTKLAAVVREGGKIYASTDSGANWTALANSPAQNWCSIASSADGNKLVAASLNFRPLWFGGVYTSTDGGATWMQSTNVPGTNWNAVASSADGSKLAAAVFPGPIYTSTNCGATWTQSGAPDLGWTSIASSADGSKLVAVANFGGIYTSIDSGTTWTSNSAPAASWSSVASSSDGNKLVAVDGQGGVWTAQIIPPSVLTITPLGNAANQITVSGMPGRLYVVQWASDLTTSGWTDLKTNTTDITGLWSLTDPQGYEGARFYRAVSR